MINRYEITKDQALFAIANGEFDSDLTASKKLVVVILTQDWCPQWHGLKSWVYDIHTDEDVDIYELMYNRVDYFNDFMNFKENIWGNDLVPYLRFYKDGKLFDDSNYISEQEFRSIMGI